MPFSDFLAGLFAGSTVPLTGLTEDNARKLPVNEIFSGINYLEALAKTNRAGLSNYLLESDESSKSSSTDSIFNKFSIFAYQNFGSNADGYRPNLHFIGTSNGDAELKQDADDGFKAKDRLIKAKQKLLDFENGVYEINSKSADKNPEIRRVTTTLLNPSAKNIIEWANNTSAISITGYQPYAMTDFMFCKYYGKIPNNRLITLRRYPFPIDDQIKIYESDNKLYKTPIPIAQAVTWFGTDTANTLSSIGVLNWNMAFKTIKLNEEVNSTGQQIDGNEITVDEISELVKGLPGGDKAAAVVEGLKTILVGLGGNDINLQQLTGMEAKFQDYAKSLYTTTGPYWNRIFGPVNVITETTQRIRGMQVGWDKAFTLTFDYQFRSFNGLSPKIVALDLIASFLNLTYNNAQFLGQLGRYFPKAGLKFSPTITEKLGKLITDAATTYNGNLLNQIMELVMAATKASKTALTTATASLTLDSVMAAGGRIIQTKIAQAIAKAIPALIPIRSALSDRPVGEWHLVVGNPMNPIMVMGDLICTNCKMEFDTEIGPDDFPTGVKFTLSLQQGKPRDKVAIERMFNLGESQLMSNKLNPTSSQLDTFGEENSKLFEQIQKGIPKDIADQLNKSNSFISYRNRIRKSYGYKADDTAGTITQEHGNVNDSLLYMYFSKLLDKT